MVVKLSEFLERIEPLLERGASGNDSELAVPVKRLQSAGAERAFAWGRFGGASQFGGLDPVYAQLRRAVVERLGEERWRALLRGYFLRYPMRSIERHENGVWLASYLKGGGAGPKVPAWLAELADLEWWEWRTFIAPDSPDDADADAGALRLASTVEMRTYGHDLVGWLEAKRTKRPRDPAARVSTVVFWRDAERAGRRATASREELALLKCVYGRFPVRAPGLSRRELAALVERLRRAHILLGRPQWPRPVSS